MAESQPAVLEQESQDADLAELEEYLQQSEASMDEYPQLLRDFDKFCAESGDALESVDGDNESDSGDSFQQMWDSVSWLYEFS